MHIIDIMNTTDRDYDRYLSLSYLTIIYFIHCLELDIYYFELRLIVHVQSKIHFCLSLFIV